MEESEAPLRNWVVTSSAKGWAWLAFLVGILYGLWFAVVLYGENQGWTDNPGAWAGLPTDVWGFIGIGLYVAVAILLLVLLVRREIPARVFTVDNPNPITPERREEPAPKPKEEKEAT